MILPTQKREEPKYYDPEEAHKVFQNTFSLWTQAYGF